MISPISVWAICIILLYSDARGSNARNAREGAIHASVWWILNHPAGRIERIVAPAANWTKAPRSTKSRSARKVHNERAVSTYCVCTLLYRAVDSRPTHINEWHRRNHFCVRYIYICEHICIIYTFIYKCLYGYSVRMQRECIPGECVLFAFWHASRIQKHTYTQTCATGAVKQVKADTNVPRTLWNRDDNDNDDGGSAKKTRQGKNAKARHRTLDFVQFCVQACQRECKRGSSNRFRPTTQTEANGAVAVHFLCVRVIMGTAVLRLCLFC